MSVSKSVTNVKNPLLAIRKASTYIEALIQIVGISVFLPADDTVVFRLVYNPSVTGGSWTADSGYCEINTTGTAISGGTVLLEWVVESAGGRPSGFVQDFLCCSLNAYIGDTIAGVSDVFAIETYSLSGAASASASIIYREIS